jgi:hypothetical protein
VFSSAIFQSICIRFLLTSVLQRPKHLKMLKTFYFRTNGASIEIVIRNMQAHPCFRIFKYDQIILGRIRQNNQSFVRN